MIVFVSHGKLIQSSILVTIYFYSFTLFYLGLIIFNSLGSLIFFCLDKTFAMCS